MTPELSKLLGDWYQQTVLSKGTGVGVKEQFQALALNKPEIITEARAVLIEKKKVQKQCHISKVHADFLESVLNPTHLNPTQEQ